MSDKIWDKFNKIFGNFNSIFSDNFGEDFINNNSTPEDFMGKTEYSKTSEEGVDENGNVFTKTIYTSKDGKRKFTRIVSNMKSLNKKSSTKSDSKYNNDLYTMEAELKDAISQEKFELASELRDKIEKIKKKKV